MTRPGWVPAPDPTSVPTPDGDAAGRISVRPSLRAAASIFAKLAAFIAFLVALPIIVAILAGSGAAFLGAILAAEFSFFAALPVAVGLLLPAVRLMATTYELDDTGVRVHSSIVARSDQRVQWDKVTLLMHHRSIIDRILGIEVLTIVAYGARGTTLNLVGLRDAAPLRDFAARKMKESASVASLFSND